MMLAKPILEVNKIGFANSEIGFVNRNTKFFRERVSGGFGERNLVKKKFGGVGDNLV
jgi:hypothetical protein